MDQEIGPLENLLQPKIPMIKNLRHRLPFQVLSRSRFKTQKSRIVLAEQTHPSILTLRKPQHP